MAVMTNMRDHTKTVLFVLLLSFVGLIIFEWGMDFTGIRTRNDVVGKIEGREIKITQYNDAYMRELESFRNQTGTEPSGAQLTSLKNRVWESFIQDVLIQKALAAEEITANNQEIVYKIFNDPPAFLRSNPGFQDENKQFDMAKYQATLNDPNTASQWRPVEEYLRQTLPYEKFQQRLRATVRVTADEIKREYSKQNQNVKVKYIFFNPNLFINEEITLSDDEVKAYYDTHSDEFEEDEKRKIDYVIFSTQPTTEDSLEQKEMAQKLLNRLKNGEDFAELAEIYSEDPGSQERGGDLGFFGKNTMVKPFEEAAFKAKIGEIVGPIQTQHGLHLIKVEDKKSKAGNEEVKARHILLKFEASRKTLNRRREEAEYFAGLAEENPFNELAEEYAYSVLNTNLFPKGAGFVPGIGLNISISNFIFSNDAGAIGDVEETPRGIIVCRIAEIQKRRIKPLDQARPTIENKLKIQKRMAMAENRATETHSEMLAGASFEGVASEDSLEIKEAASFTRDRFVQGVGKDPSFIGAAFALENTGDVSKPVKATRGYYLIQLIEKDSFDTADFDSKKTQIRSQLLQRRQSQVFANWYADAKSKADISDHRNLF